MPIWSIRIQILPIWKAFEAFLCKLEPFERDLKHSKVNSNFSKGIRSIQMQILTIRMESLTISTKFKVF